MIRRPFSVHPRQQILNAAPRHRHLGRFGLKTKTNNKTTAKKKKNHPSSPQDRIILASFRATTSGCNGRASVPERAGLPVQTSGVFQRLQGLKALYSSTDVANLYLAKGSGKSLHDMIIYQSQTIYPLWNNMVDAVREGKNQNEKTFGLPPEDIFQAIYRSEEEKLKFMGLMNSSWVLDGHDIVTAFNLSCFQEIVDLGGCTGALAREMAKAYPSSSITVFDLPQIVETAQKHFSQESNTVVFQSGDFFSGEIPPADLYVLARIIHDWPDEKCLTLLRKIYDTCKPGGGVLLVEALLFENRRGPVMAQIFSLNMLVQTEGRERPPSEYTRILNKSGFHNVQVCRTGKSYDAILAVR
ncbi:acetylserotonin O-methyltransferase 2 isoform X2 [Perca fluviatilis]|uniref:acetylserotonin O-methyltransferase 2 isoform X2 n=1 Tax=Perca fluviatilis TaxID=8168 RepID=UPI001962B4E3|nr:acetylserotonin O-methyltransferase 2 isoform X2 [Perca fluviatilis]